MARINFVELPSAHIATSERFYAEAFGWHLTSFGPSYASTLTGDVDLGSQGDPADATRSPLVVIAVDDVESSLAAVKAAGGTITRQLFSFPGGRRFHFLDLDGNELAAWQQEQQE